MTTSIDITERVLGYRECARTVWNAHFRQLDDGWHEFHAVQEALFSGLVLAQVFGGHAVSAPTREHISLRPEVGPIGYRVMWARADQDRWHWQELQLRDTALELSFLEFFDWRAEGVRDFEFVRARVRACPEDPALVGADMLLRALAVTFWAGAR